MRDSGRPGLALPVDRVTLDFTPLVKLVAYTIKYLYKRLRTGVTNMERPLGISDLDTRAALTFDSCFRALKSGIRLTIALSQSGLKNYYTNSDTPLAAWFRHECDKLDETLAAASQVRLLQLINSRNEDIAVRAATHVDKTHVENEQFKAKIKITTTDTADRSKVVNALLGLLGKGNGVASQLAKAALTEEVITLELLENKVDKHLATAPYKEPEHVYAVKENLEVESQEIIDPDEIIL